SGIGYIITLISTLQAGPRALGFAARVRHPRSLLTLSSTPPPNHRMIEGLERVLEGTGQPGLPELRWALCKLPGEPATSGRLLDERPLGSRFYRLRVAVRDEIHSLVVKRLRPVEAMRSELAARHWLPAVGLRACGPGLLGVAAAHAGQCVWHIYEDLGEVRIEGREADVERVAAAVHLIASLHSRFASNPLLA